MIISIVIINGNINNPQKIFVLKKDLVLILTNLDFVLKGRNLSVVFFGLIFELIFLSFSLPHSSPSTSILISFELILI